MTAEQRHEYKVRHLTSRLLHCIKFAFVIALAVIGNIHARWLESIPFGARPERVCDVFRKVYLHDRDANR
jgi:hypothetical protein